MKESEIQTQIMKFLKTQPGNYWRNYVGPIIRAGGRMSKNPAKGSGDILGVLPCGRFISFEVKTQTGKLSEKQEDFRKNIRENNGFYLVVRSLSEMRRFFSLYRHGDSKALLCPSCVQDRINQADSDRLSSSAT